MLPAPVFALWGAEAMAAERWADGLRADLARLTAQLRQLQAEADAAERGPAGTGERGEPVRSEEFLRLVDDMLAAARAQVAAVMQLAREESSGVVTRALDESADIVASGIAGGARRPDDGVILLGTPQENSAPAPDPSPSLALSRRKYDRVRQLAQWTRQ